MPTNKPDIDTSKRAEKELPRMQVTDIGPLGFGNQESLISVNKFFHEIVRDASEIVLSGKAMKAVDNGDDGCIDGRPSELVIVIEGDDEKTSPADNANHERAKVAGGGYITGLAMRLGAKAPGSSLDADLASTSHLLTEQGVYCGAHKGAHRHSSTTDCGANDKFLKIIDKGLASGYKLEKAVEALITRASMTYDQAIMDRVLNNWQAVINNEAYEGNSTGDSRYGVIKSTIADAQVASGKEKPVAVSKDLGGDHNEAFIVVNYVPGHTLSQSKLNDLIKKRYPAMTPETMPQAFAVDVWRIGQLAEALSSGDPEIDQLEALYAGVAYQIATAAELTTGDLPIFAVEVKK